MGIAEKLDEFEERLVDLERRARGSETVARVALAQLIRHIQSTGQSFDLVEVLDGIDDELGDQVAGISPDDQADFMAARVFAAELVNSAVMVAEGPREARPDFWKPPPSLG